MFVGLLIGVLVGLFASFTPGMSPSVAALSPQVLHLVGADPEIAVAASVTAYLFSMITATSKEIYAPVVAGTVESAANATSAGLVINREAYQSRLAWSKIAMLAVLPLFVMWLTSSYFLGDALPKASNLGYLISILVAYKGGLKGALYAGAYFFVFWLLRENVYMAFIVGAGSLILPSMASVKTNVVSAGEEAPDVIESGVDDALSIFYTWVWTVMTMGISPRGIAFIIPAGGAKGFMTGLISNMAVECLLLGYFLNGVFSGKAGIGQFGRPEYMSWQLILSIALLGAVWQLTLSGFTNAHWGVLATSPKLFKIARTVALVVTGLSLAFIGSAMALVVVAFLVALPYLFATIENKAGTNPSWVLYTLPAMHN